MVSALYWSVVRIWAQGDGDGGGKAGWGRGWGADTAMATGTVSVLCIQNMGVSGGTEAWGSGRKVWEVEMKMKLWPDCGG